MMFYLAYGQRLAAHALSIFSLVLALLSTHSYMYGEQMLFWSTVTNPWTIIICWLAVLSFTFFMLYAGHNERAAKRMIQQLTAVHRRKP